MLRLTASTAWPREGAERGARSRHLARTQTICVKHLMAPASLRDGARILVERAWPLWPPTRRARVTMWLKELGPSEMLAEWFRSYPARWAQFASLYRAEMGANGAALDGLRRLMRTCPITLLYIMGDDEHTHAVLLADSILHGKGDAGAHTPS